VAKRSLRSGLFAGGSLVTVLLLGIACSSSKSTTTSPAKDAGPSSSFTGSAVAGGLVPMVTEITHYTYVVQLPGTTTITVLDASNASLGKVTLAADATGGLLASYAGTDGSTASVDIGFVDLASGYSATRRLYSVSSEQMELNGLYGAGSIAQVDLASPSGDISSPSSPFIVPTEGFGDVIEMVGGAANAPPMTVTSWLTAATPELAASHAAVTVDAVTMDPNLIVALAKTIQAAQSTVTTSADNQLASDGIGQTSEALTNCDGFSSGDATVLSSWAACAYAVVTLDWQGFSAAAINGQVGAAGSCETFLNSISADDMEMASCIGMNVQDCGAQCAAVQGVAQPGEQLAMGVCQCNCDSSMCAASVAQACPQGGTSSCAGNTCQTHCNMTDAGPDAMQDSGADATQDSGADATQDSGADATQDSRADAMNDSAPDASPSGCTLTLSGGVTGTFSCMVTLAGGNGLSAFTLDSPMVAPWFTTISINQPEDPPTTGTWDTSNCNQGAVEVDAVPESEDDYEVCQCNDTSMCSAMNCDGVGTYTVNIATLSGGPILYEVHGTADATAVPDPGGSATGTVTIHAVF